MSAEAYKRVIEVARAEIGYLEKKSNKNLDDKTANAGDKNWTKYARDLDALKYYNGRKNGICGWCDVFVDWCFYMAYGLEDGLKLVCQKKGAGNCGAGPKYSMIYFKAKKQLATQPSPGDQIFFHPASGGDSISHTGLVVDVDKTYVYTIEGNTNGASGVVSNGGGVAEKKYKLNNSRIAGYGHPDWSIIKEPDPEPEPEVPDDGQYDDEVAEKCVQIMGDQLNARIGDAQRFESAAKLDKGSVWEYVATSIATGWHAIRVDDKVLWVSPNYSKVLEGDEE